MLQIEHLLDRKPGQLSGGQRQRVAMGRALARNPQLFLFDEPLSNLDAKLRVEMRAEIKLLHQRTRTTTVYVTHDQVEAMTLGDRIAVMQRRRGAAARHAGRDLRPPGQPLRRRVHRLAGDEHGGQPARGERPAGRGHRPGAHGRAARRAQGSQRVGASPTACAPNRSPSPMPACPARSHMIEPTGPETYALVDTPVGKLTARVPGKVVQARRREGVPALGSVGRPSLRHQERQARGLVPLRGRPAMQDHLNFRSAGFLRSHIVDTMAFYDGRCLDPSGGFFHFFKDDGTVYDRTTRHLVSSTRFVFNSTKKCIPHRFRNALRGVQVAAAIIAASADVEVLSGRQVQTCHGPVAAGCRAVAQGGVGHAVG